MAIDILLKEAREVVSPMVAMVLESSLILGKYRLTDCPKKNHESNNPATERGALKSLWAQVMLINHHCIFFCSLLESLSGWVGGQSSGNDERDHIKNNSIWTRLGLDIDTFSIRFLPGERNIIMTKTKMNKWTVYKKHATLSKKGAIEVEDEKCEV